MLGFTGPIKKLCLENDNFRKVIYTAKGGQLVLMSLKKGEEIGEEIHKDVDQFFWFVKGVAKAVLDGEETLLGSEEVLIVPRGTKHNIINASTIEELKLFTVYTPPNHPDGTIHKTKKEAEAAHYD